MNRQFNTPSPVVFPAASPTPKLYSTPSKKLPQVEAWQDIIGIESVPQQQNIYQHPFDHQQAPQQYNYSSRERSAHQQHTTSISPLSVMMESDILLDDEDISSYRFSEDEFLSSIISSSTASSRQSSPLNQRHRLRRPVSYTSPSPLQQQKIMEEEQQESEEKPIIGIPFEPAPNVDPIHERMPMRRFSFSNGTDAHIKSMSNSSRSNTKLGSFMSRFKKAATSGRSTSSLFK
ncbi:uncharacterized protein ATC70_000655 [Mucor velutinosus]|uniref:Uncharacterized protein n=1 Tax=Mucor velutinosus TaxID=708070 RepID=A0AAN7DMC6_9FUNG|nr:hypothetical protein ATC70_000655 [Mucor velutinosus]